MKDIDFDELDRAVNSLMSPRAKDEPKVEEREESAETSDVSVRPDVDEPVLVAGGYFETENMPESQPESPVTDYEEPEQQPVSDPTVATLPTTTRVPTVSRGRFMDVMRPAAREVKRPFTSSTVSRQGTTLQPGSITRRLTAPAETTGQPIEAADGQSDLDAVVQNFQNTFTDTPDQAKEDTAPVLDELLFEAVEDRDSLGSPFLPDAKVEKRPLGRPTEATPPDVVSELATNTEEINGESLAVVESPISPNKDAQLPEQPLPAELGSELLSIESGGDSVSLTSQPIAAPETMASRPAGIVDTSAPAPETVRNIMAASIPQQYKVQPETSGEVASVGAIYDTQPLAHPADKKPGWLLVVAILAILLLGAAGGAAVYFLGFL